MWMVACNCFAQTNTHNTEKIVSEENRYDTTLIIVQANDDYATFSQSQKTEAINVFLKGINTELVSVGYGNKRELWRKDNVTGHFILLDTLDMDNIVINKKPTGKKLASNHTFISFGGQLSYQNAFNSYFNATAGRFLWKDKLDIALSIGCGFSPSVTTFNIGPVSKYYYPMVFQGQKISPYVGAGISYYFSKNKDVDGNGSWDIYGTIGSAWRIGPGALDVGFRLGNVSKFAFIVGYTFLF
jgi:hypothetical protein